MSRPGACAYGTASWVLLAILVPARAWPAPVLLEPVCFGVERLDPVYENAGLDSRLTTRLGLGAAVELGSRLTLACDLGRATSHADFGLLGNSGARLERSDANLELRWQAPGRFFGWSLQPALGAGRLRLACRPQSLNLEAGGTTFVVSLHPVSEWTRHLAAEVLHPVSGRGQVVLRVSCRFYGLDVATPAGSRREDIRDVQAGASLRVAVF